MSAKDKKAPPNQDQTIHIGCVKRNSLELIDLLIQKVANVESRGANGQTPLIKAAGAGRVENV